MKDYRLVIYYSDEAGCYVGEIPELQGCQIQAETQAEAFEKIAEAKEGWLENARREGWNVPEPRFRLSDASRKFAIDTASDKFSGFITHELMVPVTSIQGYIDLMQRSLVGELTEKQSEFLDIVSRQAKRLQQMIYDWRDVSKIEHGSLYFENEIVEMKVVIENAIERAKFTSYETRQIGVVVEPRLLTINGSKYWLEQVVSCLLEWVIRYAPPDDSVSIVIERRDKSDQRLLTCTIQPTNSNQNYISEAEATELQQHDPYIVKRLPWSYDLGVFVAKSVIEMHGGVLLAARDDVAGSAFQFTLPIPNP